MSTRETSSVKPEVRLHFGLCRAGFTRPHVSTRVSYVTGTCSKDIRVSTCGMQTFTRFYDQSDFNEISEITRNQSDFNESNDFEILYTIF